MFKTEIELPDDLLAKVNKAYLPYFTEDEVKINFSGIVNQSLKVSLVLQQLLDLLKPD